MHFKLFLSVYCMWNILRHNERFSLIKNKYFTPYGEFPYAFQHSYHRIPTGCMGGNFFSFIEGKQRYLLYHHKRLERQPSPPDANSLNILFQAVLNIILRITDQPQIKSVHQILQHIRLKNAGRVSPIR